MHKTIQRHCIKLSYPKPHPNQICLTFLSVNALRYVPDIPCLGISYGIFGVICVLLWDHVALKKHPGSVFQDFTYPRNYTEGIYFAKLHPLVPTILNTVSYFPRYLLNPRQGHVTPEIQSVKRQGMIVCNNSMP